MDPGIILLWLVLVIYTIIVFRMKIIKKEERKWLFLFLIGVVGLSVLISLDISFNNVTAFLNDTFGKLSRMVVKV